MKLKIYQQSKYYEIAFSFINVKKQVILFEEFIKKYSKVTVKAIMDVACGPALQLLELAQKGYRAVGVDASEEMLDYLAQKIQAEGVLIELVNADMNDFTLKNKVDFAYILMGSIIYARNNNLMLSHLDSVARSLNSGGLYLIENLAINWADPAFWRKQSWIMKKDLIRVRTSYQIFLKSSLHQTVTQVLQMEVKDNKHKMNFIDKDEVKIFFPQEFKLLVEKNNKFEFLGFFVRDGVEKLRDSSADNIVLLRRK